MTKDQAVKVCGSHIFQSSIFNFLTEIRNWQRKK
jgi:hypothetical protein